MEIRYKEYKVMEEGLLRRGGIQDVRISVDYLGIRQVVDDG